MKLYNCSESDLGNKYLVSYRKEDCSDLHVMYFPYLYKYIMYFCMLKLAVIFLIKLKDQLKFMYYIVALCRESERI